ncbi:MAG: hypothetical protein ACJ75H_04075 [Thermoanaerobaculia bacterium]
MTGWPANRPWRFGLAALLAALLAKPSAAGEFRLLVEGEAGVRDDGSYGSQQEQSLRNDQALARAGINLQLSYQLERMNLALSYFPSYERSLDDADISGTTQRLDFGLVADISQTLRLNIRERLLQTPDLYVYTAAAAPDTTVVTRSGDQLIHFLDVSADQAFSRRASLTLGVSHSLRRFEESNLIDSETRGARVGAGFELSRGQRIDVSAGLERFDYKDRGDADVRRGGVGYATEIGKGNHLRLEAGAYSVDSTTPFVTPPAEPGGPAGPVVDVEESDSGWRGGLQFSQERRLFRWGLGLSHDISAGAGLGRAAVADNGFVAVSTNIGRDWTLGLDGNGSRQTDLSSRGRLDGLEDNRNDELTELVAGTARFGWTFAPAFRLDGGYSRVWQRARVEPFADLSYSRYFLSLAFRIYRSGEAPTEPENVGRPSDENADSQ